MKVFIDCEFLEYHKQPKFMGFKIGKPIPTTELISIALVAETGEEFYAESNEFNMAAAKEHDFLPTNVLPYLGDPEKRMPLSRIAAKIRQWTNGLKHRHHEDSIELVGYWSSYDWWVMCTNIFGSWTKMQEAVNFKYYEDLYAVTNQVFMTDWDLLKKRLGDTEITHNALDDARWLHKAYILNKIVIEDMLRDSFAKVAHQSWKGLMEFMSSKGTEMEDGSFVLKASTYEKWMLRANTRFEDLDDKLKNSHMFEANKYVADLSAYSPYLHTYTTDA